MTISVTTDIHCDTPGCGQWVNGKTGVVVRARDARDVARADGWHCSPSGRLDLCPECLKRYPDLQLKGKDSTQ